MVLPALALSLIAPTLAFNSADMPLLMRHPTTNGDVIVFEFANDLWSVPMAGGSAVRITNSPGVEMSPYFSPDGKTLAFSAQYDGNVDVFTMPAEGGIPKRLTAHPLSDNVQGWTPDGKGVLFWSGMASAMPMPRLFTVPATGGIPKALPLPTGQMGAYSPDGSQIAYVAGAKWQEAWKRYRGGQAYAVWIARLSDSKWEQIPKKNENNEQPMWVGDKVYYLSDKGGIYGIMSYDTKTRKVAEEVKPDVFDVKSATAGPGVIVYERLGSINVYDLAKRESHKVPIRIQSDFPEVRTEIKPLGDYLNGASISPTGQRLVVTARGRVFTVPAAKGNARQLTEGDGIDRRDPAWSPDGKFIAYVTDENFKQELALLDLSTNETKFMALGDPPAYYSGPTWSPDSKKIAYTDNRHTVWVLDVDSGKNTSVDSGVYTDPYTTIAPRWSPDSKWLTWSRDLDSHMNAVFVYGLETGKTTQITDGMANAKGPIFDRDGKHLYFYASTNTGQSISWLDLTSFNQANVTSRIYAVVLSQDGPNPLQPQSDEEPIKEAPKPTPPAEEKPGAKPEAAKPDTQRAAPGIKVDLDKIEQRIIVLPIPEQTFVQLEPGPAGSFFALAAPLRGFSTEPPRPGSVLKFSFESRQPMPFASMVGGMQSSGDGSKLLMNTIGGLSVVSAMAPAQPGQAAVNLGDITAKVDPRAEWARMYNLVWRNERLNFYDPNLHGANVDMLEKRYEPFLAGLCSREDLNYLFTDMLGELSIGHMFIGGGDTMGADRFVPGGLLGADYTFEGGRYKLARIYDGERWNPTLRSPLAQPGVNAKVGEYVLAIDGKELNDSMDIYETLEGKANKQVKVKLGPSPSGLGSREVVVVPVASENGLRFRAWGEDNRRRVSEATGGKMGYVHVPDTAEGGWTEFNRYYFAQVDKKGMVVDERFNSGGLINNFMVDEMQKTLDAAFTPRHGKDWPTPGASVFGPKVMIINAMAGSGGDMFPWLFRERKIGPIIGKRTWGGLVAAFGFSLPDGGSVRSPDCAFYNPNGTWDVEGYGVDPDIDVELDPYLWRQGKDSQLERAIEEVLKAAKTYKYPNPVRPKYPDRSKVDVRH